LLKVIERLRWRMKLAEYARRERSIPEIRDLYTRYAWLYELDDIITLFSKKIYRPVILDRARIRGDETVVEVASGTGEMSKLIAKALKNGRLICVDVSPGTLAIGRRKLKKHRLDGNVDFIIAAGEKLPLRSKAFNVAICCYALDTVKDAEPVISEMHRVLKPHGRISVGYKGYARNPILKVFDRILWEPYLRLVWNCGAVFIKEMFSKIGFRNIVKEEHMNGYYHIIYAEK
jgi:ubiquinone/menaquinone biosynthesis C-methylase UbiE